MTMKVTANPACPPAAVDDTGWVAQAEDVAADDPGRGPGRGARRAGPAARLSRELLSDEAIDELLAGAGEGGLRLTGQGGFLPELIARVLERGMGVELADHLGYDKGDPAGRGSPNSRNGATPKTLATEVGDVAIATARDRVGTFEPRLVPKGERRLDGLDAMIISLYAGGMTVRDGAHVVNKAAHLAVGVDTDGVKHVLGIWVQSAEGAKFWALVCAQLANRGVTDVLIACCDGLPGLPGLPEAIEATWPHTVVQTCVVHLIRAANRYVSYTDRKAFCAALKTVYTAAEADAAETALLELSESPRPRRYPAAVAVWQRAWERFTPFLAFPPAVRRVIYTTNSIESLNYQLRKIIKNRGHFPSDDAVIKLLWLAIGDIEDKRARAREKDRGKPANQRNATVQGWRAALNQLELLYPDRLTGRTN